MDDSEYHNDWQIPEFLVVLLGVFVYLLCAWNAVVSDKARADETQVMPSGHGLEE